MAETKERPILFSGEMVRAILDGRKTQTRRILKKDAREWIEEAGFKPSFIASTANLMCPYGCVGERLWVRETWGEFWGGYHYRATDDRQELSDQNWRPSIHMPRAASRITLEITGVRVERLQEISGDDCAAEGIEPQGIGSDMAMRVAFESLWTKINGPCSWEANPWVWVLEFSRV